MLRSDRRHFEPADAVGYEYKVRLALLAVAGGRSPISKSSHFGYDGRKTPLMNDKTPPPPLPRNVKVLGLVSLLNDTASEMIFPLLPSFVLKVLGGDAVDLGAIEGTADSLASLLKLWSGGWSDRVGKRKGFLLFGYSVAALTRPLIGFVTGPWQLFGIRLTDRMGKGIRTAPRDALIADSTEPALRGRAFGFHRSLDHLGAAIGPLLAMTFLWFRPDDLRLLFELSVIPGLCVVLALALLLKEVPAKDPPKARLQLTLAPFDKNFRVYLLSLLLFTLGNSSDAFLLMRAEKLGTPVLYLPLLWCLFHIVKSYTNFFLGRVVDAFRPRPMIIMGWMLYAVVYLAFAFATQAWHAWALFFGYALFFGLTEPAEKKLVADLVGPERKGLAYGWYNFAIGIATLPASLIFGALYKYSGPLAAFGFSAVLAVLASVVLLAVVERKPENALPTV